MFLGLIGSMFGFVLSSLNLQTVIPMWVQTTNNDSESVLVVKTFWLGKPCGASPMVDTVLRKGYV
jgi:hypothetical protein